MILMIISLNLLYGLTWLVYVCFVMFWLFMFEHCGNDTLKAYTTFHIILNVFLTFNVIATHGMTREVT